MYLNTWKKTDSEPKTDLNWFMYILGQKKKEQSLYADTNSFQIVFSDR